jgi:hypothetical protein
VSKKSSGGPSGIFPHKMLTLFLHLVQIKKFQTKIAKNTQPFHQRSPKITRQTKLKKPQ